MRVVCDIECNSLTKPTKIWVIVLKDIDTGIIYTFRNVLDNEYDKDVFLAIAGEVDLWIGHNFLNYDYMVLHRLLGLDVPDIADRTVDTYLLSKLVDYPRQQGHSIEAYGEEFGLEKIDVGRSVAGHNPFFNQYSEKMEEYCVRDVEICSRIYHKYADLVQLARYKEPLRLEQHFEIVCRSIHDVGFAFDDRRANRLLEKVTEELKELDKEILDAFPPRLKAVKVVTPRLTAHGTLNRSDFRFVKDGDLSDFNGGPFTRCSWVDFNPASHKQLIEVLNAAGWVPTDKTQTHIDVERALRIAEKFGDPDDLKTKLEQLKITGWSINELNLSTLPARAPKPARSLAKRILLESRRRTLTEWLSLVRDGRIHGKFHGIGTWTHRTTTQTPNMQNIPNEFEIGSGKVKLLGKEMRQLWRAPPRRLLVGVDAEAIQLRVFAHLIDDKELTEAIVNGNKKDKTDPHSLNQRVFGEFCKTRNAAKHSLYAIFFGGRANKISQIMDCTKPEAEEAIRLLLKRYPGLVKLEKEVFPRDARKGYFVGLDGRHVPFPVEGQRDREHLCMSGYLQCGEAVIMKMATLKWHKILEHNQAMLVNFVHDEWQTEVPNNMEIALDIAAMQADSLYQVGVELGLKCPLAGSYWNDDHEDYTIGTNWYQTH